MLFLHLLIMSTEHMISVLKPADVMDYTDFRILNQLCIPKFHLIVLCNSLYIGFDLLIFR